MVESTRPIRNIETIEKEGDKKIIERNKKRRKKRDAIPNNFFDSI